MIPAFLDTLNAEVVAALDGRDRVSRETLDDINANYEKVLVKVDVRDVIRLVGCSLGSGASWERKKWKQSEWAEEEDGESV